MPITPGEGRERRAGIIKAVRWQTLWLTAVCLPSAPALADLDPPDEHRKPGAAFPAPVEIIPAPLPLPAAATRVATPAGYAAGARPIALCDGAGTCTEMAPIDWQLGDPYAAKAAGTQAAPASERFPLSLVGVGGYRRVGDGDAQDVAKVGIGAEDTPRRWADHVPAEYADYRGFWKQSGKITTELLLFGAYFTAQSGKKLFRETSSFKFNSEHWFGKDTSNVGVDKLTHAFDTYLIAEVLHMRLHKVTNASAGDAWTAAILASTFMALNEISDGIEPDHGYSMEDITMNLIGAAFSVVRNTVPGVREKLAFKIEIMPNDQIYSYQGKEHFEQQRFMLSLKGAGFKGLQKTPLRFIDFQIGYYASDFLEEDRAAGIIPKRHLFVGLGLNVGELLFGRSRSKFGRAANTVLDYLQLPYTSLRYDTKAM